MPFESTAPDILKFVDTYIDSFVSWEILSYFHENPDLEKSASRLALDIGRRVSAIEPWLAKFVEQGIIGKVAEDDDDDEVSYRYVARSEFKKQMDRFIDATRDRTARLAIVGKVLQKESKRL